MEEYLEEYGHTINRRLFDFAVSLLRRANGNPVDVYDKKKVEEVLTTVGVEIPSNGSHDAAYVFNLMLSEQEGGTPDVAKAAADTKRYIDNQYEWETRPFDELYIKTVALGIPVYWDEML